MLDEQRAVKIVDAAAAVVEALLPEIVEFRIDRRIGQIVAEGEDPAAAAERAARRVVADGAVEERKRALEVGDAAAILGGVAGNLAAKHGECFAVEDAAAVGARDAAGDGQAGDRDAGQCGSAVVDIEHAAIAAGVDGEQVRRGTGDGQRFVDEQFAVGERDGACDVEVDFSPGVAAAIASRSEVPPTPMPSFSSMSVSTVIASSRRSSSGSNRSARRCGSDWSEGCGGGPTGPHCAKRTSRGESAETLMLSPEENPSFWRDHCSVPPR